MTGSRAGCRKMKMVTKQIGEVSVLSSLSYCGGNLCIIIITTKFFLLFFINFFFVNFARQTIMAAMVFSFNTELNEFNKINY